MEPQTEAEEQGVLNHHLGATAGVPKRPSVQTYLGAHTDTAKSPVWPEL